MAHAILLISCPDRKGITAAVTGFVSRHDGNILHADQHIDDQSNIFFMRVEWDLEGFSIAEDGIREAFRPVAEEFAMDWDIYFDSRVQKAAVFVSRHLHCLQDVLLRKQAGQLRCEIPVVISNHPDAAALAKGAGSAFYELPVTPETKADQEKKALKILQKHGVDLVVLARYHQILSGDFLSHFPSRVINIHHSFLPAFAGKNPYYQAYQKGVKLIGATSHYVTEVLDEGPIIEQDIVRVSHRDTLADLIRKGEDLERVVLYRALRLALGHKILSYQNKTVVFD